MSRKDFQLIADVVASLNAEDRVHIAMVFANALATTPRFDREQFIKACVLP